MTDTLRQVIESAFEERADLSPANAPIVTNEPTAKSRSSAFSSTYRTTSPAAKLGSFPSLMPIFSGG